MNAICLVVDRLHAGYVGAYGNSWIETPALDRLASQSLVFDRAVVDSPQLERLYRSYWQGWHAMCPAPPASRLTSRPGLAALLREAGVATALLTDEPQVARHPLAVDFDELIEIDPPWQPQSAGKIEQTHFARCFVQMINWLEAARGPFLLWCHLGGLGTTWDAPPRFRQAYWDQGDPQPPTSADVPDRMLPADHDPDERLGITQSYAGQVALLDTCLGAVLEFLDGLPAGQESLLTLISARGFPLGEHLRVGPCDDALYGELVHVPWMLRFPPKKGTSLIFSSPTGERISDVPFYLRSQALVEPADLWATLLDWWGVDAAPRSPTAHSAMPIVRRQSDVLRDRLCVMGNGGERAIRTPAWYLRAAEGMATGSETGRSGTPCLTTALANEELLDVSGTECLTYSCPEPELFAKPDDRWEVNNVASRCREVVECLQAALTQYELTLPAGRVSDLPPLSDVLLHGL